MICSTYDERFRYFIYNNQYYGTGTKLAFNDALIKKMAQRGLKVWKYAQFNRRVNQNGKDTFLFVRWRTEDSFCRSNNISLQEPRTCEGYVVLTYDDIVSGIEDIIEPVIVAPPVIQKKYDWDYPELMVGWIVYIISMIGCLIFNDVGIFWTFASIIFFSWRKGVYDR